MKDKTNTLLVIGICVLFLILSGEIYYLFFYQKKDLAVSTVNKQTKNKASANPSKELWLKQTDTATESQFKEIHRRVDRVKPLFQSGVLKELLATEVYKSIVEEIGSKAESEKNVQGAVIDYAYVLSLSTFSEKGEKAFRYTFTNEELPRISAFKSQGDEEIPIDLDEIQKGDFVSVTITYDHLLSPQDNLISLKIVKLL